jgi:hypothetical protein
MSHARFAPSDAERWTACTGAIPLQEKLIKEGKIQPFTGNEFTREGSAAHALFNHIMLRQDKSVEKAVEKFPKLFGFSSVEMRQPMRDAVDYATSWQSRLPDAELSLERKVFLGFTSGTLDMALVTPSAIHVFDLKWGEGVSVPARANPQLALYAIGLSKKYQRLDIHHHIIQPRIRDGLKTRHWKAPVGWHAAFEKKAQAAVNAAMTNPTYSPSESACRWCVNKGHCPALVKRALSDFRELIPVKKLPIKPKAAEPAIKNSVAALTYEEMGRFLSLRPFVELFYAALADAVWHALMSGKRVPQWKIVESRTARAWKDPERVIQAFKRRGIALDDFMPRTLVGITRGEALLDDERLMASLVNKAAGTPTIAHEADSRPELKPSNARKDFGV